MPNYLKMPKQQQVTALLALDWSYRRIEAETGVRRETVSRYDRRANANAAKVFPGSAALEPPRSRCTAAAYRAAITEKCDAGLSVQRSWQDLVEEYGYGASYESVKPAPSLWCAPRTTSGFDVSTRTQWTRRPTSGEKWPGAGPPNGRPRADRPPPRAPAVFSLRASTKRTAHTPIVFPIPLQRARAVP